MKRVCNRPVQLDAVSLCYEVVHPYYYERLSALDYGECLDMDEFRLHVLTINDDGRILKKAFLWKANEGMGDIEIVKRLALEGMRIDRKHLNKILHNPFYCGYIRHNLLGYEEKGEPILV